MYVLLKVLLLGNMHSIILADMSFKKKPTTNRPTTNSEVLRAAVDI